MPSSFVCPLLSNQLGYNRLVETTEKSPISGRVGGGRTIGGYNIGNCKMSDIPVYHADCQYFIRSTTCRYIIISC